MADKVKTRQIEETKEINDTRKSIELARLVDGWTVAAWRNSLDELCAIVTETKQEIVLFRLHKNHNFFTVDDKGRPHLMPYAWEVLVQAKRRFLWEFDDYLKERFSCLFDYDAAIAQDSWLNKIHELFVAGSND